MNLLILMLPVYLLGNLHCLGMCGPVAMVLGGSPYRAFYLLGRLVSFTLAGTLAGALGQVIGVILSAYHLSGWFSIIFGLLMAFCGLVLFFDLKLPFTLGKQFTWVHDHLNRLLFMQAPWPLFLVGFLTIFLPCGQTLLVYSACALSGSALVGTLNGFVFGLLTTPSLFFAMHAKGWIKRVKGWYHPLVGVMTCLIGLLAVLRGLADWDIIPHFGLHPFMIY